MKQENAIIITDLDLARLGHLADDPTLAPELDRADIVPFRTVPPNVVTMNSRVVFKDETTGEMRTVTIVYPQEADPSEGKISVMAPVGSALLGLSVGQSIEWCFPDGHPRTLRVLELLHQPEAEANASRPGKALDSIDAALDAALGMTFPASDPVALSMPDAGDRRAPEDQGVPAIDGTGFSLSHGRQV